MGKQCILFSPIPADYSKSPNLKVNNINLTTNLITKILDLAFHPKLEFLIHIKYTKTKAYKTMEI